MACRPTEKSYGYESSRFEKDVDEHFHCSICYNVLKEPRMCRNNEHMFCLDCITEHLKVNSETCPECSEHLKVDTLRRPRVVNNILSKLKIKCDFASRGCPEFVCVEVIQTHVENCGFAPVLCSNEECGMEINRQDKVHHETEVCEYRRVKCHNCGRIQEVVERLEENVMKLDKKVEAARAETRHEIDVARKETKNEVKKVKKEVEDVKENISRVSKVVNEVRVMMNQMSAKITMLKLLNKLSSPSEGMINTPKEDILIASGGYFPGKSAEIFSWEKEGWFKISEMSEQHHNGSSFIYKDLLFVVGGYRSKTIETLNLNELPLKWIKFPGELPYACNEHQTVVYQQRIIHNCGYNYDKDESSNVISELQLTSPCVMKELCQMPKPRKGHGAEIFENKVLILGVENEDNAGALDGVLEFDVTRNTCREMPSLPLAFKRMTTVPWRDQVVVLGGQQENYNALNSVFMYDCKTGEITRLPSMLKRRCFSCAVITGNTIVVMGGVDEDGESLKSVECFTVGSSTSWAYLPAMSEFRCRAIVHVLPSTRKYV